MNSVHLETYDYAEKKIKEVAHDQAIKMKETKTKNHNIVNLGPMISEMKGNIYTNRANNCRGTLAWKKKIPRKKNEATPKTNIFFGPLTLITAPSRQRSTPHS